MMTVLPVAGAGSEDDTGTAAPQNIVSDNNIGNKNVNRFKFFIVIPLGEHLSFRADGDQSVNGQSEMN